ncbi:unnamed protein product [Durusdinium trenchii]|uniref:Uncharacterized protein n=1 Tax=Durusdinium trenchii TaxID=1381693 RepID=A0ABP0LJM7_9DINO
MAKPWQSFWLILWLLPFNHAQDLALGVISGITSWNQLHMAIVAAVDMELRKHFEPGVVTRFGPPFVELQPAHPEVANITMRIGTSHSNPQVGVGTALDFMFGANGLRPVVGLVGVASSSMSIPVASVARVIHIPQVCFASTSPTLSDKELYPYFLRTVPPDALQAKAFWNWLTTFQVPRAVCLYAEEPYGRGLYLAIKEQAVLAHQSLRIQGAPLRYMPIDFVISEAKDTIDVVKSLGSHMLFLSMNRGAFSNFIPVMQEEGLFAPEWQILASEAIKLYDPSALPAGFMYWHPVSEGPKYETFLQLWRKLRADDVTSTAARERFQIDNFRVPLDEARSAPITDADFESGSPAAYSSFLFDAIFTFVMAINTLLNDGVPASEIKGEILLAQVKRTNFEGISGHVSFDQNGNRQTAYQLLYWPPASNASNATGRAWTLAGAFDAGTNELDITSHLYWMTGQYSATAPAVFTACSPGFYKDQVNQCIPCEVGFFCGADHASKEPCPRGFFSNVTGLTSCLPCDAGSFAEDVGSIGCASCLPGFYAEQGQESCKKCAQGTYQPSFGSAACLPCELGQVTAEQGSQSLSDCQCARASFMCNHSSVSSAARGCRECPMGLECMAGLDPPLQEPGYWAEAAETCDFQVLRCRSGLQCPGLELGACAAGRMGIACNNCKVNHYPQEDGTCAPCHGEDVWPFILSALAGVALMFLCASSLRADLNQHSLNLLTVAAVGGQMVVALQALRSIRQLGSIRWVEPLRKLMDVTKILAFDLDIIKISCILGTDSPTLKFVCQMLICPVCLSFFGLAWFIFKLPGRKISSDKLFNLCGILVFALFISLTLAVLDPLQCQDNPNGSSSMVSNPGIICFNSAEHTGLVILSAIGLLCYPVAILTWASYTTLQYPARVNSGQGLRLVHRHRFLFQRFKPDCYYYGWLLLVRNSLVALFPVMLFSLPEIQLPLMGVLLMGSGALQIRVWPWRTKLANIMDLVITCILQILLLGIAPLVMLTSRSTEVLGWILVIAILSPLLGGLIVITHAVLRHFRPGNVFGVFLCHHKGGAGALCRWMKLMAAQHSSSEIFLDSDQLEDLDLIFDTIRAKTRSVVVVLTSELLQRMWCAGEIVTAFKNHVCTLPLVCDGYEPLTDATFMEVPSVWTEQQKQILAFYGISMEDVIQAYRWLHGLQSLTLQRRSPARAREQLVVEILQRVKVPLKLFRPKISHGKVKARILLTGSVSDAEALSTLEVFQHLLQRHLRKECAVVRSGKELLAYKPWAYYLVVLLSRGILRDPGFAQTLLSVYIEDSKQPRPLELVTVNADTQFQFPSPEFLVEVEEHGLGGPLSALGPELSKAYRGLLNILALPLSPMASQGLLERQTAEVCRRFRRYKNSVFENAHQRTRLQQWMMRTINIWRETVWIPKKWAPQARRSRKKMRRCLIEKK